MIVDSRADPCPCSGTMASPEFASFWTLHFADTPPLGHRLRLRDASRWLRIHALPGGERYASSDTERDQILARLNGAATAVLGDEGRCWLVAPDHDGGLRARVPHVPAMTEHEDVESAVVFLVAPVIWRPGAFDELLGAVADDRCRALWIQRTTAEVFAPYDGGADLVLATPERRDELRDALADWVSPRADGL